jgi:hypothetical protein
LGCVFNGRVSTYEAPFLGAIRKEPHGSIQVRKNLLLALIGEHLEVAAAVVGFVVWKGPNWGLSVLALEKAWEERCERRAAKKLKQPADPGREGNSE